MQAEIALAQSTVEKALKALKSLRPETTSFAYDESLPREMKAASDLILEDIIITELQPCGFDILSEEAGLIPGNKDNDFSWVVDPLDGTVNFMRGIAPCSISLALFHDDDPILGVIGEYPSGRIAWGGKELGAYCDGAAIHVSDRKIKGESVICSGFPSRFEFDEDGMKWIDSTFSSFAKVRMLGAASLSLLHVAKGSAEAYCEREIMIWDVAAGLAILEGAGGRFSMTKSHQPYACSVFASNGMISNE